MPAAARTHHARAGLRAASSRVSRHQPHPRRVQRAPRPPHAVRARRARTEVEARLAAHAVPAAAAVLVGPRRGGAAHRRRSRMARRCRCRRARCSPGSISTSSSSASRRATIRSRSCSTTTREALRRLCVRRTRPSPALRVFEKRLLASLGYGLEFDGRTARGLLPFPRRRGPVRSARGCARAYPGRCLLALQRGSARRRASRSTSRGACCARRSIIVWKAASCARAPWRARWRGEVHA